MAHLLHLLSLSLSLSIFNHFNTLPNVGSYRKGGLSLEYGIVEQFGKEEKDFQGRKCVMGVRKVYINSAMGASTAYDSSMLAKNWPRRATKNFFHRVFWIFFAVIHMPTLRSGRPRWALHEILTSLI